MPDASPTKWHLGHTTWFFETLVLMSAGAGYEPYDPRYSFLFNSYYEALGARQPRPQRGMLSRPSVDEVLTYRRHVDDAMAAMFDTVRPEARENFLSLVELGLSHEEQHQELLLTDIKHAFSLNPLLPAYTPQRALAETALAPPLSWMEFAGGIVEIGDGGCGFAFDNERPRHKALLNPFRLATRAVTCGEYAAFIDDGGYRKPELWLSEGWANVTREGWQAPLYWRSVGDGWKHFTLHGERHFDAQEPVAHVSFFEAAAFAAWAGKRLPTEFEWEHAASVHSLRDEIRRDEHFHPRVAKGSGLVQMFGDVWQWTRSSYDPYPGYRPFEGAISEYNGKFMVGQLVLRGGSCATPPGHSRETYRNFFPPAARWQFSSIRLADDA